MKLSTVNIALLTILSAGTLIGCNSTTSTTAESLVSQSELAQLAQTLDVSYQHVDNLKGGECSEDRLGGLCFQVQIDFTSKTDFAADNWQIYLSHIAPMQSFKGGEFNMEHVNGDLHKITPSKSFTGFKAGQAKALTFYADGWSVSSSDAFPNYYIVADGLEPQLITSTVPVVDPDTGLQQRTFVAPRTIDKKDSNFKRTPDDAVKWATAERLYHANIAGNASEPVPQQVVETAIVPTPKYVKTLKGAPLDFANGYQLNLHRVSKKDVGASLERLHALGVKPNKDGIPVKLSIVVKRAVKPEGYELIINAKGVEIIANDAAGLSYGVSSLASLMAVDSKKVPLVQIFDEPHYSFRGLHIDVARNFHSKELILQLIEQMSVFKLNKLHLHLADDEGWRVEIDGLPELTDIGANRCFDLSEDKCLQTQLGSGPFVDTKVNGFYSKAEYQEILRYASAHHVQVIPSLDMPGHSRAAVKAMEARYRKYKKLGDMQKAEQYLLTDYADMTKYQSIQFYSDNTINVCMDSSYKFIEKVIDEVKQMHAEAGHPLTRYHIGADETAGAWVESPICNAFMAKNPQIPEYKELTGYFIERIAKILTERDIETAGWGDGMSHTNKDNMPKLAQANAWTPLFWDGHRQAHELVNRGWEVVVSIPEFSYFDFPYEADPLEHGYYWASRHTNSRKVFEFMPDNLPIHGETKFDRMGKPMVLDDTPKQEEGKKPLLPIAKGKGFVGVQGHLWSENVLTDTRAMYMLFPRMISLAERAWHNPKWAVDYDHQGAKYSKDTNVFTKEHEQQRAKDWQRFAHVLGQKVLPKFDKQNVFYRLPTVGAVIEQGKLHANVIFPGLRIEYQVDNGAWKEYTVPVAVNGKVKVRSTTVDGSRKSRVLSL